MSGEVRWQFPDWRGLARLLAQLGDWALSRRWAARLISQLAYSDAESSIEQALWNPSLLPGNFITHSSPALFFILISLPIILLIFDIPWKNTSIRSSISDRTFWKLFKIRTYSVFQTISLTIVFLGFRRTGWVEFDEFIKKGTILRCHSIGWFSHAI